MASIGLAGKANAAQVFTVNCRSECRYLRPRPPALRAREQVSGGELRLVPHTRPMLKANGLAAQEHVWYSGDVAGCDDTACASGMEC